MFDFILNNLDFILCSIFCVVHFIVTVVSAFKQNKKINSICDKCGSAVVDGETHKCTLTFEELSALVAFIKNLDKDGVNND